MKLLFVSGFLERIGDDSAFWEIADRAEQLGHEVTRRQWDTLVPDDLAGHDAVVTYSYGQAAFWHAFFALAESARPLFKLVCVLVGVPRFIWEQLYGSPWHMPPQVQRAVAFNLHGAVPASAGIHNATAPDVNLADLPSVAVTKYMNVTCDGPGVTHCSIQGVTAVQDAIIAAICSVDD